MSPRAVQDLPVPILTDEELLAEYDRTFHMVCASPSRGFSPVNETMLARNAAAMGELVRRGYQSMVPRWRHSDTRRS